jgi:TonB-linked SusC/RagA family outer membrane protein
MKQNLFPELKGAKKILLPLLFLFITQMVMSQARTITGTVTSSEDGAPIPGLNIIEKGTTNGTITNMDGKYTITVNEGATLVFSYVGLHTREIAIGNMTTIDLVMEPDYARLDEVVIVGYGSMKKSDLTGAVASITNEEIEAVPIVSMEQAMDGRLAGVHVTQASHAPGGGITVRIRGGNSINSQVEPLYVIDGFPVYSNNNQIPTNGPNDGVLPQLNLLAGINPGDIERIEVLKDASATAIYGARGANGVILITTKRGTAGKPKVEYSTYYGIQNIAHKIDMLDAYQFATVYNEMQVDNGQVPLFTGQTVEGIYYGTPEEYRDGTLPSTDWQDEVLRTGNIMNHQLSLTGGSENTQFAVSANHLKHNGIVIGGDYTRTTVRTNLDSRVTKWLSVGTNLNYSHNLSNNSGSETGLQWFNGGTISAALKSWPTFSPYDENGNLSPIAGNRTLRGNPVAYAKEAKNLLTNKRMLGDIFGIITFMEGLSLRVSAGVNINDINRERYFPTSTYQGFVDNGSANKSYTTITSWLNENILTYDKSFGEHSLNAVAGFTLQQEVASGYGVAARDFPSDIFEDNNLGAGADQSIPGSSFRNKWSMVSWLGRINYNLMDKYLFTVTGRADGSSKFGAENRWAFFPSFAVAWRLSQENFIQNLGLFSNLKLRLSYGKTGNSEIGIYQSQALLGMQSYSFGEGFKSPGVGPERMANPELKWETTSQYDGGLELGFINNRLNLIVDGYYKKTTDLLLNVNIPATSGYVPPYLGFQLPLMNVGSLENKGLEFTANYDIFPGDFKWRISGNIFMNRNEVLELTEGGAITLQSTNDLDKHGGRVYVDVGLPVGVWRRSIYDGIFNDQAEVDAYVNSDGDPIQAGAAPGDVKYVDVNGDGVYDGKDLDVAGDPNPDYIFGITNDFAWKGFEMSIFINGSQGNDINSPTFVHATGIGSMGNGNLIADMWNRWTPENTDTDIPRAGADYTWGGDMIYDGSFVRIKNIRLSYNIPTRKLAWLRNGQVYLNIQNLFTFTDYPGYDPEVNSAGQSPWQRGIDLNSFPATRTFMLGLKVGL